MKINASVKLGIVVPAEASAREQFASEELHKYLSVMFSGIDVSIVTDAVSFSGNKILIGGPERNKETARYISEADFDAATPGPEGMYIKAFGDDTLVIAGSSKNAGENERGTLYAVYELLERYFGCILLSIFMFF